MKERVKPPGKPQLHRKSFASSWNVSSVGSWSGEVYPNFLVPASNRLNGNVRTVLSYAPLLPLQWFSVENLGGAVHHDSFGNSIFQKVSAQKSALLFFLDPCLCRPVRPLCSLCAL